jgi:mono/diheme cytochrome c family protein
MIKRQGFLAALIGLAALSWAQGVGAADPLVERGRYLVRIAGCNDCHTAGYIQKNGAIPEQDWLKGDAVGWRGPWGTTYAINLRLYLEPLSEEQWLTLARHKPSRPPMPWYALRDMSDEDLRALYRFIRHLGPAGSSAPGFVPPGQEPVTAFISFVPQSPGSSPATGTGNKKDSSFWDLDFKSAPPRIERP